MKGFILDLGVRLPVTAERPLVPAGTNRELLDFDGYRYDFFESYQDAKAALFVVRKHYPEAVVKPVRVVFEAE